MELFEIRLKKWEDKDFTSGEIYISFMDEIGTIEDWFEYVDNNTLYDEVSIRKVNKKDTETIIAQITEQQQVEEIYEMFGDDMTPYAEVAKLADNDNTDDNIVIIEINISQKVWEAVNNQWRKNDN
jgi:organic radical activating enzyme